MINNTVFKIINYGSFMSVEYPWIVTCEADDTPTSALLKKKKQLDKSASFTCQSHLVLRPLSCFSLSITVY